MGLVGGARWARDCTGSQFTPTRYWPVRFGTLVMSRLTSRSTVTMVQPQTSMGIVSDMSSVEQTFRRRAFLIASAVLAVFFVVGLGLFTLSLVLLAVGSPGAGLVLLMIGTLLVALTAWRFTSLVRRTFP